MSHNYDLLGKYIRPVDERNKALAIDCLLGLSISKRFIPSIANTVGTEFNSYKIVHTGQFAYGPVTSRNGDKITIALLDDKDCIISSSYSVFEIIDTNKLLPEYLMLWFRRPEFDRYARYKSHGSVREIFGWDEMCQVELPVPSIEKQKAIVNAYQTITDRIALKRQINDNLEATAQALFKAYFVDYEQFDGEMPCFWKFVTLADIAEDIICGKTPPTADEENYGDYMPFITIPDMHGSVYATQTMKFLSQKGVNTQRNKVLPINSICVSCIATAGLVCLTAEESQTNQQINSIICKPGISPYYVYLKMATMSDFIKRLGAGGSTTCNVNKTIFSQIEILLPDEKELGYFHANVEPLFLSIRSNQYELQALEQAKILLLVKMTN